MAPLEAPTKITSANQRLAPAKHQHIWFHVSGYARSFSNLRNQLARSSRLGECPQRRQAHCMRTSLFSCRSRGGSGKAYMDERFEWKGGSFQESYR